MAVLEFASESDLLRFGVGYGDCRDLRIVQGNVRAAFHQLSQTAVPRATQISHLGGLLGYLKMFPKLANSPAVKRYERNLQDIEATQF